jgi:hypothetical protein
MAEQLAIRDLQILRLRLALSRLLRCPALNEDEVETETAASTESAMAVLKETGYGLEIFDGEVARHYGPDSCGTQPPD